MSIFKVVLNSESNKFIYLSIFPFYADIDMTRKGAIYHGEVTDVRIRYSIGAEVRKLCKDPNYSPTWAYIVTWYGCEPNSINSSFINPSHDVESDYSNTFQLLMISDGFQSFAMIKYVKMDWPDEAVVKEFSSYYNFFVQDLSAFPSPTTRNDMVMFENKSVRNLTHGSNMNRSGHWFISFDDKCHFKSV